MLTDAADKSAAAANEWRVSEASLLMIGLVGGGPGAFVNLSSPLAKRVLAGASL